MPNLNINFGGGTLTQPGVYVFGNVTTNYTPPAPTIPPLLYVGYGYGLKPKLPYTFTTPQNLLSALRGGPATAYVNPITLPGPAINGANYITFIDASENTVASGALLNTTGGVLINMYSTIYGPPANLIQVAAYGGSVSGTLLEVYDGYSQTLFTGDNIGYPFLVGYTGTATGSLSFAVSGSYAGSGATGFYLNSPNSGESFVVPLNAATYPTVTNLVQYINGTGFWTATVLSSTNGNLPTSGLDIVSGALSGVSSGNIYYKGVPSSLRDAVYWLNNYSTYVSGGLPSGIVSGTLSGQGLTALSGAQGVAPTLSDYATALNVGLSQPAWVVFMDNNSASVQALGSQHAQTASQTQNGSWRRFFTGSTVGDSIATTISNAQALNSKTSCYLYPGVTIQNSTTGVKQTYGGLYAAAAAAGAACGNFVAMPLTNKALNAVTTETTLTLSQINQLQNNGVMVVGLTNNIPTIISDVTTWQQDSNPENVFTQQVACLWWVCYSLVAALQPYIGGVAAPSTETSIGNALKSTLNSLLYTDLGIGASTNGVLASWTPGSLVIGYNGSTQQWNVQCQVALVGQNRFITVTVYASPYNSAATVVG